MIQYSPTSLNFPIAWNIKKEPIFRIFDDEKWLNNFFDSGEIMLSCFNNFRKYKDEMQGDQNEGEAIIGGEDEKGDHNYLIYESGLNAYILCATSQLNEKVKADFNGKCAIKINNPTLFGLEVSKKLPFVNTGLEGNCIYGDSRMQIFEKEMRENKIFQNIKFQNNPYLNHEIQEITMGIELFMKLEKYEHQKEYRLIWFSNAQINESIIIKCPEAVEYCEKIIF